ncbi:MAG: alpha amylase C-terminal domain-containing protein [Bacteroidales bacterium]|nr:alpha amylase C-terminal domain-containing protein [Bacteroidales bacterium]MCL2738770.1 alpha amylase C-terminal domain-containing protein [Bacteroidales bacterium]
MNHTLLHLALWENDPWLEPYQKVIRRRHEQSVLTMRELAGMKPLSSASDNHLFYGVHRTKRGWVLREWAPHAKALYLIYEANGWARKPEFAFSPVGQGNWELNLPSKALSHGMLYKWYIEWEGGGGERLPAYARRCVQDAQTLIFSAQVWEPPKAYRWRFKAPPKPKYPLIYEAHIGMGGEEPRVHTFNEFREVVLPRIVALGYNTLQLMAIQEHPYYGSFGYQVSNFFAVSSRFGTPDELKALIDEAHKYKIAVLLDIVHSHAVKNEVEGLSRFDGATDLYFHAGERGEHPAWSSRCFNYGKNEVLRFLLSNCKFWMEEYRFDGFRFDGVTSMMYYDHGLGRDFGSYDSYFDGSQDEDAIIYLTLANRLVRERNAQAFTIAEDVSGMPGLAAPFLDGGMGFDFRLSMGVADLWIKWLKERPDESWDMGELFHELTNKRADERTISYSESHDQAMVGDKTLIFRMIDAKMYDSMDILSRDLEVDRGIALHKVIRLLTLAAAGDGYLTFMGNEFGHPEWIDFPREGNAWSYAYARRQWSLADHPDLKYKGLEAFDAAMIRLAREESLFSAPPRIVVQDNASKVLIFTRGHLLFVFNVHPQHSYSGYSFGVDAGKYRICLDSDASTFGGFSRNNADIEHFTIWQAPDNKLSLYLPARTAMVLKKF